MRKRCIRCHQVSVIDTESEYAFSQESRQRLTDVLSRQEISELT